MKKSQNRKITLLNTLGSLGYVACLLQWAWLLLIFLPSMVDSPVFQFFTPASQVEQPVVAAQGGSVPLLVTVLALVVGVGIVVGSLYVIFVKFPQSVAKGGEVVTHSTAKAVSPIVIQHVPLSAKQQRTLPATIIVGMKLLLVFLPLCLLIFARELTLAVSFELIILIGIGLFSWTFLLFAVQFALSRLLRIDYKTIR